MSEITPTDAEKKAIRALKRVAKNWPDSLWLFSANGTLCVMQSDQNGERALLEGGGMDPDYCIGTINIRNDGGDW